MKSSTELLAGEQTKISNEPYPSHMSTRGVRSIYGLFMWLVTFTGVIWFSIVIENWAAVDISSDLSKQSNRGSSPVIVTEDYWGNIFAN